MHFDFFQNVLCLLHLPLKLFIHNKYYVVVRALAIVLNDDNLCAEYLFTDMIYLFRPFFNNYSKRH